MQACLKEKEEARLAKDARQEAKEHEHALLKVEYGIHLSLEARRRAVEEDFGIKAEEARLKAEAEEKAHLKAE